MNRSLGWAAALCALFAAMAFGACNGNTSLAGAGADASGGGGSGGSADAAGPGGQAGDGAASEATGDAGEDGGQGDLPNSDGGGMCSYTDGGPPADGSAFNGVCPPSGCPAGTVCVFEIGGVAGGGGEYCAPIPNECHGTPTCACMAACACTSGFGRRPERCTEQNGSIACDNGIR